MNTKDWRHKPHNIDLTEVGKVLDGKPVAVLDSNQLFIPDNQHKNRAMEDWAVAVLEKQGIVKQLQNTKNKNNALCINILRFKFNPVCHYEPSRKAWRGNPIKNRRFFINADKRCNDKVHKQFKAA